MCLAKAILQQVLHHKHAYMPEMAFKQVTLHMLRNPSKFYPYMEQGFAETGESYESYVTNIFRGKVWGDDLIAAAFWRYVEHCDNNHLPRFHKATTPIPQQDET